MHSESTSLTGPEQSLLNSLRGAFTAFLEFSYQQKSKPIMQWICKKNLFLHFVILVYKVGLIADFAKQAPLFQAEPGAEGYYQFLHQFVAFLDANVTEQPQNLSGYPSLEATIVAHAEKIKHREIREWRPPLHILGGLCCRTEIERYQIALTALQQCRANPSRENFAYVAQAIVITRLYADQEISVYLSKAVCEFLSNNQLTAHTTLREIYNTSKSSTQNINLLKLIFFTSLEMMSQNWLGGSHPVLTINADKCASYGYELLRAEPTCIHALTCIGMLNFLSGDIKLAEGVRDQISAKFQGKQVSKLIFRALIAIHHGKDSEALHSLTNALDLSKNNLILLVLMHNLLARNSQAELAEEWLERAKAVAQSTQNMSLFDELVNLDITRLAKRLAYSFYEEFIVEVKQIATNILSDSEALLERQIASLLQIGGEFYHDQECREALKKESIQKIKLSQVTSMWGKRNEDIKAPAYTFHLEFK